VQKSPHYFTRGKGGRGFRIENPKGFFLKENEEKKENLSTVDRGLRRMMGGLRFLPQGKKRLPAKGEGGPRTPVARNTWKGGTQKQKKMRGGRNPASRGRLGESLLLKGGGGGELIRSGHKMGSLS